MAKYEKGEGVIDPTKQPNLKMNTGVSRTNSGGINQNLGGGTKQRDASRANNMIKEKGAEGGVGSEGYYKRRRAKAFAEHDKASARPNKQDEIDAKEKKRHTMSRASHHLKGIKDPEERKAYAQKMRNFADTGDHNKAKDQPKSKPSEISVTGNQQSNFNMGGNVDEKLNVGGKISFDSPTIPAVSGTPASPDIKPVGQTNVTTPTTKAVDATGDAVKSATTRHLGGMGGRTSNMPINVKGQRSTYSKSIADINRKVIDSGKKRKNTYSEPKAGRQHPLMTDEKMNDDLLFAQNMMSGKKATPTNNTSGKKPVEKKGWGGNVWENSSMQKIARSFAGKHDERMKNFTK